MSGKLVIILLFLVHHSGIVAQNDSGISRYPFQVIDSEFVLTSMGSKIVEVTNQVNYFELKNGWVSSFGYDATHGVLLTLEESEGKRFLVCRSYNEFGVLSKDTLSIENGRLTSLIVNGNNFFAISIIENKAIVYSLSGKEEPRSIFIVPFFVRDISFDNGDSSYYICSDYTIYRHRLNDVWEKICQSPEKINRMIYRYGQLYFSTSAGSFQISNTEIRPVYNNGGYFEIYGNQFVYWERALKLKFVSIATSVK
jgi:hypothetical protein